MSEYTAIRGVTRSLRDLLQGHITDSTDPELTGVPIDLRSPREMREVDNDQGAQGVSLWLYRAVRDGQTLNKPPQRVAPNQVRRPSLPMNLYYLITPIASASDDEQLLLGKVLEVLNDHPTLRGALLSDSLEGGREELRVTLEPLTLEELTRVWDALKEPYQLSVSYLVQVVDIDSGRESVEVSPVEVRQTEYHQVLSAT